MSARLRNPYSNVRACRKFNAHTWILPILGILATSASCGPIAKSAFKTNRFAAPSEREDSLPSASEQASPVSAQPAGLTPVLEVRKPLPITYITRVVDASSLESLRTYLIDSEGLTEALFGTSQGPAPSPSPSASGGATPPAAGRITTVSAFSESYSLNESQLEALQTRGSVDLTLPELPVGMSPDRITGVFHVVQNDEFELMEEDEGLATELDLFKAETGYQGTLRTRLDPAQDQSTASTLSRTVRVELELEATLQGPVTAGSKSETASVPGTVSTR